MFETIKDWFAKRRLNKYRNTHYISDRGTMVLNYILNKYVNGTKPKDYIEAYEETIIKHIPDFIPEAREIIEEMNKAMKIPEDMDQERLVEIAAHTLAAHQLFMVLIALMPDQQREYWYQQIEDENMSSRCRRKVEMMRM